MPGSYVPLTQLPELPLRPHSIETWACCAFCGAVVQNLIAHDEWHVKTKTKLPII